MDWLFGTKTPTKEDMLCAMLDAQSKIVQGLLDEVKQLSAIVHKLYEVETNDVETQIPVPLHKKI